MATLEDLRQLSTPPPLLSPAGLRSPSDLGLPPQLPEDEDDVGPELPPAPQPELEPEATTPLSPAEMGLAPPPALLPAPVAAPSRVVPPTILGSPAPAPPAEVRLADPSEIEFAEEVAPELSAVERLEDRVVSRAQNLNQADDNIGVLDERARFLAGQLSAEKDPQKRAILQSRINAVVGAAEGVNAERAKDRVGIEEDVAQLKAQTALESANLQREATDELRRRRADLRQAADEEEATRAVAEKKLRAQYESDVAEYREALKSGASKVDTAQTLIDIFGETLRASIAGTVPNYSAIMERSSRRELANYQKRAKARLDAIGLTGDAIRDSQRLRDETSAQQAAAEAALMREIEEKLQGKVSVATSALDRVQASTALQGVRAEREAAEQAATAARAVADRKRLKEDADLALVGAKTEKEIAMARKARADAAKAERRGRGGRAKAEPAGITAPNIVTAPGTDTPLVTFKNDKVGIKEAGATRQIVGETSNFLELMNEIGALVEDADDEGVLESLGVTGSEHNLRLKAKVGLAKTKLAQMKAGIGKATTEGDDKWAEEQLGVSLKAWTDSGKARARIDAITSVYEQEARSNLQSATRLDSATREKVVKSARVKRESKTRAAKKAARRAPKTLTDPQSSTAAKLEAVQNIEEAARLDGKEQGIDWLPIASARLSKALPSIKDPDARAAADKRLRRYDKFASERIGTIVHSEVKTYVPGHPVLMPRHLDDVADMFLEGDDEGLEKMRKKGFITDKVMDKARRAVALRRRIRKARMDQTSRDLSSAGKSVSASVKKLLE